MEKKKTRARPRAKTKKSNVTKVKTVKRKKATVKKTTAKKAKHRPRTNALKDYVIVDPKSKKIILEAHFVDMSR